MNLNNLSQFIDEPTRITDNTESVIDLILTPCPGIVKKTGTLPPVNSDHHCVFVEIFSQPMRTKSFKRTIYNYNKLDIDTFKNKLAETNWDDIINLDSLNEATETLTSKLTDIAKQCMPSKIIKVRVLAM